MVTLEIHRPILTIGPIVVAVVGRGGLVQNGRPRLARVLAVRVDVVRDGKRRQFTALLSEVSSSARVSSSGRESSPRRKGSMITMG